MPNSAGTMVWLFVFIFLEEVDRDGGSNISRI